MQSSQNGPVRLQPILQNSSRGESIEASHHHLEGRLLQPFASDLRIHVSNPSVLGNYWISKAFYLWLQANGQEKWPAGVRLRLIKETILELCNRFPCRHWLQLLLRLKGLISWHSWHSLKSSDAIMGFKMTCRYHDASLVVY